MIITIVSLMCDNWSQWETTETTMTKTEYFGWWKKQRQTNQHPLECVKYAIFAVVSRISLEVAWINWISLCHASLLRSTNYVIGVMHVACAKISRICNLHSHVTSDESINLSIFSFVLYSLIKSSIFRVFLFTRLARVQTTTKCMSRICRW